MKTTSRSTKLNKTWILIPLCGNSYEEGQEWNVSSQDVSYSCPINLVGYKVHMTFQVILSNGMGGYLYCSLCIEHKQSDGVWCLSFPHIEESSWTDLCTGLIPSLFRWFSKTSTWLISQPHRLLHPGLQLNPALSYDIETGQQMLHLAFLGLDHYPNCLRAPESYHHSQKDGRTFKDSMPLFPKVGR